MDQVDDGQIFQLLSAEVAGFGKDGVNVHCHRRAPLIAAFNPRIEMGFMFVVDKSKKLERTVQ